MSIKCRQKLSVCNNKKVGRHGKVGVTTALWEDHWFES